MTNLEKPIRRLLPAIRDRKNRPLIVTISPDQTISFRAKGSRYTTEVHIAYVAQLAQAYTLQHAYDQKMQEYATKKKAGYKRLRKPVRPCFPFGRLIVDTLRKGV